MELVQELTAAGVSFETPSRDGLTFDSVEMYTYINLTLHLMPLAIVIRAYIKRNEKKRVTVEQDGKKIDITGYNEKQIESILEKSNRAFIKIKDE